MTKQHTTRDGWEDFVPTLRNREDFKTSGALYGTTGVEYLPRSSWLPSEYAGSALNSVYAVWSYDTPIAWANPDGTWTVPDVKYSVTTSRHQSKIRTAVDRIDALAARAREYEAAREAYRDWNQSRLVVLRAPIYVDRARGRVTGRRQL